MLLNQGVLSKAKEAPVSNLASKEEPEKPKSSMFVTKRELVNRSTDVAGIIAKRFGAKPVEQPPEQKEEMNLEDEFAQNEFDLPRESFFDLPKNQGNRETLG